MNTLIRITRPRTPGTQRSMKRLAGATGSSGPGGGSGLPYSAATFASMRLEHAIRFGEAAVLGEPARAFRQAAAQEHDDRRGERADQHHPAPALDSERRRGHEQKARNEMIGTQVKPIAWLTAKARPAQRPSAQAR